MSLIRIDNVSKIFREGAIPVTAVEGVSLTIEPGTFDALSGPSGSGKTTLLNLIGCLDRPTSGKIFFETGEVSSLKQQELTEFRLRKVGFIFQDFSLIPTFSVLENIEFVLWLQGLSSAEQRQKAMEVCARFGIEKLLHRRPSQLSRGQQQRVAVARAIVHRPSLVLGDELTANLDHQTGRELMEFLKKLNQEEGITFLYATHDPVMLQYANRVIKLRDGHVLEGMEAAHHS